MRTFRDIDETRNLQPRCDDALGGDMIAVACVQIAATVRPDPNDSVWLGASSIDGNSDATRALRIQGQYISRPEGRGHGVILKSRKFGSLVACN